MGRVEGWEMATSLLRDTAPMLPLAQQTSPQPPPLEMQAPACVQTHCDKLAFRIRDKEASQLGESQV